jgi:hypothetical protein
VPVESHVTSGWSAGATFAPSASRSAQSKFVYWSAKAGVIQLVSLASVGDTLGVDSSDGLASSEGAGVSVDPSSPTAVVAAASVLSTGRNSSLADDWMRSSVALSGVPGIETTTFWSPCVVISASETPLASMRSRMIDTAWLSCSPVTSWPSSSWGARMICVPPSRSSANFGVHDHPAKATPAPLMPTRRAMMTVSQASERQAFFTGVVLATYALSFL